MDKGDNREPLIRRGEVVAFPSLRDTVALPVAVKGALFPSG
jgi:hypothetical protein